MKVQKNFVDLINVLRLPLTLGVVLIHSSVKYDALITPFFAKIHHLFSELLVAPCVPLFFFISGFLFFFKVKSFDLYIYGGKLKRRVKSLLIPYLFWNFVVLGYYLLGHLCLPNVISSNNNNVLQYSVIDFIRSFWDYPGGFPICFQFWYIRDLMKLCLLSPIVFLVIRFIPKWAFPFLLFFFILFCKRGLLGPIIMFTMGGWFAFQNIDVQSLLKKLKFYLVICFSFSIVFLLFFENEYIHRIMVLSGMSVYILFFDSLKCGKAQLANFGKSSFFIYGFHGFPIVVLTTTVFPRLFSISEMTCLIQYILAPSIVLCLSLILYKGMKKFSPKLFVLINGGRE